MYDKWFINKSNFSARDRLNLRKDWISIGLAKSCQIRSKLYIDWCGNKTASNWNLYIDYKRKLDPLLRKARFNHYNRKFNECQSDAKKTWQLINRILGRKRSNKLLTFPNNDAAHNFNHYFTNIAHELNSKAYGNIPVDQSFKEFMPNDSMVFFENCEFLCKDVKYFISKLNNSKSTYYSPRVLKLVNDALSPILAKLFNKYMGEGIFPDELKIAKIIPLYKNDGKVDDVSNYRPISMLPTFAKIFEKLIHKELSNFLDENNIINESQYGFRKKHSTFHALAHATENIYRSLDKKLHTLGIFVDYSKAFDTVSHSILLDKLSIYGIKGNMLQLMNSYLSDRKQYVYYGGQSSSLLDVKIGVPQGSVLGPLLFILFVNDISNVSDLAKFILFADDLNLFLSNPDRSVLYEQANQILDKLYDYCRANRLIINFKKCCYIEFKPTNNPDKKFLGIHGKEFKKVEKNEKCKFLGVYINQDLSWNDQTSHVISQVAKSCGAMYSIRVVVPHKFK